MSIMRSTVFSKNRKLVVTATPTFYILYRLRENTVSVTNLFQRVSFHRWLGKKKILFIADILDDARGIILLKDFRTKLLVWNLAEKTEIHVFKDLPRILAAKLSPDHVFILHYEKITIQDYDGENKWKIKFERPMKDVFSFWGAFVYTQDESFVACPVKRWPRDKRLTQAIIVNGKTKSEFRLKRASDGDIIAMAFSPSSKFLAFAHKYSLDIGIYDWRKNELTHKCPRSLYFCTLVVIKSIFFSDCDSYIAVTENSNEIFMHHLDIREQRPDKISYPTTTRVVKIPKRKAIDLAVLECCVVTAKRNNVRLMVPIPPNNLYLQYMPGFNGSANERFNLYNLLTSVGGGDALEFNCDILCGGADVAADVAADAPAPTADISSLNLENGRNLSPLRVEYDAPVKMVEVVQATLETRRSRKQYSSQEDLDNYYATIRHTIDEAFCDLTTNILLEKDLIDFKINLRIMEGEAYSDRPSDDLDDFNSNLYNMENEVRDECKTIPYDWMEDSCTGFYRKGLEDFKSDLRAMEVEALSDTNTKTSNISEMELDYVNSGPSTSTGAIRKRKSKRTAQPRVS